MIHTRLKEWHPDRLLCTIDPITLTGLALAGAAGAAGTAAATGAFNKPQQAPPPTPTAPPASPAPPASAPAAKPNVQFNQPSFLGAAATPPVISGQKTLLGQ